MSKLRKLALAAPLALLLAGCGSWYGSGVVLEKEYHHSYVSIITCGKSTCPYTVPECYWMKVRADDGEHDGCVRAKVWEDATVGQRTTISEDS